MAGSSSPRPDDNDCLRLPAASSPRTRGAEKKESTGLRLSQPCQPYVTPSSISSFGRRLSSAHIAERKSVKNSGENTICQSSVRPCTHKFAMSALHPLATEQRTSLNVREVPRADIGVDEWRCRHESRA